MQQQESPTSTSRQWAQLLPRTAPSHSTTTTSDSIAHVKSSNSGRGLSKRRPKYVLTACESCRKRKTACNAERPRCSMCVRRNIQCRYDAAAAGDMRSQAPGPDSAINATSHQELIDRIFSSSKDDAHHIVRQIRDGVSVASILQQTRQSGATAGYSNLEAIPRRHRDVQHETPATAHSELLSLLRQVPEQEAQDILRRLRSSTDDSAAILNHIKAGNLLLQMAVVPETRFRYVFPYKDEMPMELNTPDNPYLGSLVFEAASIYSSSVAPLDLSQRYSVPNNPDNARPNECSAVFLTPFHGASIVDARLSDVTLSAWTTVSDDDMLMRDLLRVWLRCEYQFTAVLQKDYFLEDMEHGCTDFCSSLLVNTVLAYSCVCYPPFEDRAEYWNPHTLTYRFFAEAKRIWELEALEPRLTTVQTGILFSVFYYLCGLDELGQTYRKHAVALAHKMRLFEKAAHEPAGRMHDGKAYLAWALFNWETLVAFSFVQPPSVKTPPDWPLPDPSQNPQYYGEIWLKYPLSHTLSPSYFGHMFKARSKFRILMNEACQLTALNGPGIERTKAYALYSRLKSWYDNMPAVLLPRTIVLPAQLQLYIYYHHLLLTIFEPLCDDSNAHLKPSPQSIVLESKKHLQTLIRLYYVRHGFGAMDLFLVIPLMLAASDCVEAIEDMEEHAPTLQLETMRSNLILAIKGLHSQRRNHYLAEALFRVVRGRMRPSELALLRDTMTQEEVDAHEKINMPQMVRSHWPVNVVKKKEDLDSYILTNLLDKYVHLDINDGKC